MYQTTSAQKLDLYRVAHKMSQVRPIFPVQFIVACVECGSDYEGVHNLLVMWETEENQEERDAIIQDLKESIFDINGVHHTLRNDAYFQ